MQANKDMFTDPGIPTARSLCFMLTQDWLSLLLSPSPHPSGTAVIDREGERCELNVSTVNDGSKTRVNRRRREQIFLAFSRSTQLDGDRVDTLIFLYKNM